MNHAPASRKKAWERISLWHKLRFLYTNIRIRHSLYAFPPIINHSKQKVMSKMKFRKCRYGQLLGAALLLAATQLPVACVDDSYDLDKVDLTMGLGSDGLSVKLGNTEKILLGDILEVDKSVKLDGNNLYYFVKSGETSADFDVPEASGKMESAEIYADRPIVDYESMRAMLAASGANIPNGNPLPVPADMENEVDFSGRGISGVKVTDVPVEIKYVQTLYWKTGSEVSVVLNFEKTNNMASVNVNRISDFTITLPERFKVASHSAGWTLSGNKLHCQGMAVRDGQEICRVKLESLEADRAPKNDALEFSDEELTILASGKMNIAVSRAFTMQENDYLAANLNIGNGNQDVVAGKVTGIVDPEISPEDVSLEISDELPDFLQDDDVYLSPTNPTLRFSSDFTSLPVDVSVSALLLANKAGIAGYPKQVSLPSAIMDKATVDTAYYYRGSSPYDPEGVANNAEKLEVQNLNDLFGKLPDEVNVSLDGGKVKVPANIYTVELDRTYRAQLDYSVFLPFEFDSGLTIVYNDSTESMNDDLEDYSAEGMRVNATAQNTIPLKLIATITAEDVNGNEIPGVKFTEAEIAAGDGENAKETELVIDGELSDPSLLKKVDRFKFHVKAASGETATTHRLVSTQYLRLANVKLRLKGQVIADFN